MTASLLQAYALWPTSVLVELDLSGCDEHWRPAALAATPTADHAGDLARVLADLAADGAVRPTADDSSAVREKLSR